MKRTHGILKDLQVTEKGTAIAEKENKYFFRVAPWADKADVKRAVEEFFKVSVVGVNTMRYRGKKKRERTAKYGRKPDWKRAVVTLATGSSIDLV